MRVDVKTVTVYKFAELSEKAQDAAVDEMYNLNVDYDWWDSVYEDAERVGLKLTEFDLDRASYAKGTFIGNAVECARKIIKEHGDSTETYKTARSALDERKKAKKGMNVYTDLEEYDEEWSREFLHDILEDYRIILQEEYEYQTSREAIVERIEANEYEFTEAGEFYY